MSHIHLPDGVLPISWWLPAYIATFIWLGLALRQAEAERVRRKLPFLAGLCALMLLMMSIPLGPLPIHINLTVLTGIIVGPWLGFVAVFVVNIMLSFLGHGGLTAVGLNTLITGLEVLIGWWLYHRLLQPWRLNWRTITATALALLVTASLALSVVGLNTGIYDLGSHAHDHHHDHSVEQATATAGEVTDVPSPILGVTGVSALGLVLALGLGVETLATWGIIGYLQKVRPELLLDDVET